ncbi:ribonuclease J [Clostridiales bacterium F-3ap]|uniref:Ribonuclease J n=2 Tax=Anaerotalea alkaliphila TaxID=2662126 RepID=A0A7X5HX01_9FIRM|nr:ribonuclease J [Anaerotalea alkaliphila]
MVREAVPGTEGQETVPARPKRKRNRKPSQKRAGGSGKKIRVIPLGGLEQIGMNITVFEYEEDIILVDCGLAFPGDEMLGIDLVIPDITYLKNNRHKVRGIVLTHGHEDHIGSLAYVLRDINVPVYGTRLTIGLVENKLREHGLLNDTIRHNMTAGDTVNLGKHFKVEYIRSNHSIADAAILAITTPAGLIVHTGDFKVDYTPIYGQPIDLARLGELGRQGVLLLLADSTNAERKGFTMSEKIVGRKFDDIFADAQGRRLLVATFASNVDRVQQIVNSAAKFNRKVIVEGRSMVNVVTTAMELGYIKMPEGMLIPVEEMNRYKDGQIVIISTGSQGEPMSALSRMAAASHRKIAIQSGDLVILSSKPIPGNEKTVSRVINELFKKGADVIYEDAHVSGHAHQEELKLVHTLVKPQYFIPVHGEYRMMKKHQELAMDLGLSQDNTFILAPGDVFELSEAGGGKIVDKLELEPVLVDGLGVGDVGNIVLRDRQKLSQDGLLMVVVSMNRSTGKIVAGPDIVSRGFVYVRESNTLMDESKAVVRKALEKSAKKNADWSKMKTAVRDDLRDFYWAKTKRNPMILPVIMDV